MIELEDTPILACASSGLAPLVFDLVAEKIRHGDADRTLKLLDKGLEIKRHVVKASPEKISLSRRKPASRSTDWLVFLAKPREPDVTRAETLDLGDGVLRIRHRPRSENPA